MPPVQHSSSSRSAHKESDQIPSNQNYTLGDYSFRIERSSVPGSTNDKIEAICTDKDGKNARKSIQVPSSTQLSGWFVEANETEATVYATLKVPVGDGPKTSDLDTSPIAQPITATGTITRWADNWQNPNYPSSIKTFTGAAFAYGYRGGAGLQCEIETASEMGGQTSKTESFNFITGELYRTTYNYANSQFTHNGKTVYYVAGTNGGSWGEKSSGIDVIIDGNYDLTHAREIAWTLVYGNSSGDEYETKEIMVGRFAIDIEDAGGVGPDAEGGDDPDDGWDDPDDYYDDDYDDYDDTEEYDDELYLELDKWDGEPGESFTVTITGHNGESVVVSIQPNDATEEILTYRLYAPASKDAPLTYTFTTDESWMAEGIYSRAFLVTATTDETARTANDGFTLHVEEPDMLTVDTDMDEGQPGETITAYVGGHSGHTFSAVVTNAVGDIVATFSHVVPQSQYSDVELPIVLNEAWFSSNSSSETLIITATTDDNRQASAVFKMVLEPLTVSLDVDKYTAEVGEEVTWSMEAEGGNGNYQYNFFIFLDGELVRDGRWQFDNFLTYTPHSPGTYTVEGYAKDSRLSQNVKAPEDGEVIVEGEPEPEPEPEPDEITRTLYITVTGALSGRHNDPGKDPSYSYLPADKSTIADYGCGGDGGHGGGGGAGASNVVVYKFATDKADSKEITAITKRPGFGSGGGKGGKGGDGCILVYY